MGLYIHTQAAVMEDSSQYSGDLAQTSKLSMESFEQGFFERAAFLRRHILSDHSPVLRLV